MRSVDDDMQLVGVGVGFFFLSLSAVPSPVVTLQPTRTALRASKGTLGRKTSCF